MTFRRFVVTAITQVQLPKYNYPSTITQVQLPKYKSENKEDAFSLLRKPVPKVRRARRCQMDVKDTLMNGFFTMCSQCAGVTSAAGAENFRVMNIYIYRVSQKDCARLRENVPYVKVH